MAPTEQMDRPVQLISIDDAGQCHLQEDAAAILGEIRGHLAVVGIAGLYRTGKSFLLNRLLGRQAGFEVGPSVNACTKGLWIWGRPVELAPNYHCILIDTEGLGSAQRTANIDMQIFSLCLLLSSYFVYNSMGAIDDQAIDDLHLVLNLAQHIHAKSGANSEGEVRKPQPYSGAASFLWVLRDFHLRLVNSQGRAISEREYLESALEPVLGQEKKNIVCGTIRDLFPQRDCVTLVRPVDDEENLRNVGKLPYESLRLQFRTQVEAFVNKVFAAMKPKQLGKAVVSGPIFATLASEYCKAINNSAVPTIQSTWDTAVQQQLRKSLQDAAAGYRRRMDQEVMQHLPLSEAQLQNIHRQAQEEAFRVFHQPGFEEGEPGFVEHRRELESRIEQLKEHAEVQNASVSRRQCQSIAEEMYGELIEGKLNAKGSYQSFEELTQDWDHLRAEYMQQSTGPAQAEVLSTWLLQKMTESMQRVHDQLRGQSNERANTLQLEHTYALEAERARHSVSLEQAKRQWLSEREELQRRLEAAARPQRTMPLPPELPEGGRPPQGQSSEEVTWYPHSQRRSLLGPPPSGALSLASVVPTASRIAGPAAKRKAQPRDYDASDAESVSGDTVVSNATTLVSNMTMPLNYYKPGRQVVPASADNAEDSPMRTRLPYEWPGAMEAKSQTLQQVSQTRQTSAGSLRRGDPPLLAEKSAEPEPTRRLREAPGSQGRHRVYDDTCVERESEVKNECFRPDDSCSLL